jgi:hypothetical protein
MESDPMRGSQVHFTEVVRTNVPVGTMAQLRAVAEARGEKPAAMLRAAVLALVREADAAPREAQIQ